MARESALPLVGAIYAALAALAAAPAPESADAVPMADGTTIRGVAEAAGPDLVLLRTPDAVFLLPRRAFAHPPPPGPAPAPLPDPGPDRLLLRDGGLVTGEIVAETPEALTVRRHGRQRTIPRARVDAVERAGPAPLMPAMESLARAAALRLADPDAAVRESALATLKALGPAARPVLWEAVGKQDLPAHALDALKALLGEPLAETPPPRLPPRLFRLLRDPAAGEAALAEALSLTPEQRVRVRGILAGTAPRLREAAGLPREQAPELMRSLADEFRRQMAEVLTDVQRAIFVESLAEER